MLVFINTNDDKIMWTEMKKIPIPACVVYVIPNNSYYSIPVQFLK